jgi:hypothetical protein
VFSPQKASRAAEAAAAMAMLGAFPRGDITPPYARIESEMILRIVFDGKRGRDKCIIRSINNEQLLKMILAEIGHAQESAGHPRTC